MLSPKTIIVCNTSVLTTTSTDSNASGTEMAPDSSNNSQVADFYKNKTIFITGGTGFVGICLINKLLTSCPDIKAIYLLLRPKKGKEVKDRLKEVITNRVFETLLQNQSENVFDKLHAIAGDVGQPSLGLSEEDRKFLLDNVEIVFHSAATLDFAEKLKSTVDVNLLGTRRIVELCKDTKNIQALVHVSSAYVNSFLFETTEKLYPIPADPAKVIELVNTLSESALEEVTPNLLKNHPNTYTFTKHLAEHEVNNCANRFPCAIVRPSMITAAWKEPVPGWTISKNGPQGFMMGAAKGVIRRLPVPQDLINDYIPVDIVVNELIVAGFHVGTKKPTSLSIFHCTSSTYNPFRWNMITDRINECLHKYPLKSAVWYPYLKFVSSIEMFKISAFFCHMIPAIILDNITKLTGGRPILVKLHTNVNNSLNLLKQFIVNEWKYHNDNTLELHKSLSEVDQENFNLDISTLKWDSYFIDLSLGVRKYLNKEGPETLEAARGKDTMLMIIHLTFQALLFGLIWFLIACIFGTTMGKCAWIVPLIYILFAQL